MTMDEVERHSECKSPLAKSTFAGDEKSPVSSTTSDAQTLEYETEPSSGSGSVRLVTKEFGILPIPKWLRYDPDKPFKFSYTTTGIYAVSTTIIVANLYYCQPLLIEMAKTFDVSYEGVSRIPTCVQAGYAVGLFLICPLGDIVRRRQLVLSLVLITTLLTLGLALTHNLLLFEALSFLAGMTNVAPQILTPLVAETAPAEIRAFAFSLLLTGLMFGILLARVVAGIIGEFVQWWTVYCAAVGVQGVVFVGLYLSLPDHPAKVHGDSDGINIGEGPGKVPYWKIHWSMGVLAVTEPIAVQVILYNLGASACFAYYWVTLTFLLGEAPYHYSTLEIGLFGLIGMAGVAAGPISGRVVDRILPWHSLLISTLLLILFQAVQVAAGGIHISAVVISCFGLDWFQQIQTVALATYIFSISKAAISRLNALYMISFYIGQIIGTAIGTRIFVQYGWRASAAFALALYGAQLLLLLLRGPTCAKNAWFGGYKDGIKIPGLVQGASAEP